MNITSLLAAIIGICVTVLFGIIIVPLMVLWWLVEKVLTGVMIFITVMFVIVATALGAIE